MSDNEPYGPPRWRMVCKVCGWRGVWHDAAVTGGVAGDCPQCGACDWTDEDENDAGETK